MAFRRSSDAVTRRHSRARIHQSALSWTLGTLLLASGIVPVDANIISLTGSLTGTFVATAAAADPDSKPVDKFDRSVSSHGKIKLNYYSASWPKVFQDLEESFEMEFVGDHLPAGRFSRTDQAEHTLKDAIRIINAEIEPQGFRLVEKGRFLVLLETTLRRPRAPVPVKKAVKPSVEGNQDPVNEPAKREATEKPHPLAAEPESQARRSVDANRLKGSNSVRQVAYQDSDDRSNVPQLDKITELVENWNGSDEPQVHLVHLRYIAPKPTAELLVSVFGSNNDSISQGIRQRGGVAAMSLGQANSLLILASEADLAAVIDLANQLDNPIEPQTEFQVFRWRAGHIMDVDSVIAELSQQRKSLAARAQIMTCPHASTIIVRARPQDLDEIETWLAKKSAQLVR